MERLITLRVQPDESWGPDSVLELWIGTEGAASLAASTPAGGTKVSERRVWPDRDECSGWGRGQLGLGALGTFTHAYGLGHGELGRFPFGGPCAPPRVLNYKYNATNPCANLPVGAKIVGANGVSSAVYEELIELSQRPRAISALTVAKSYIPYYAKLTWSASPDVPAA